MSKRLKIEAIVPAAGLGLRLKSRIAKPLVLIKNYALIIRALRALDAYPAISEIILLTQRKNLLKVKKIIGENIIRKLKCVVAGGSTRKKSVEIGLKYLDKDTDFVLIHDGARPFATEKIISRVISAAKRYGAAIAGVPLKPTIKSVKCHVSPPMAGQASIKKKNIFVDKTLDRRNIWEIQTPQVFRRDLILKAHSKFKNSDASDDAYLVEKLGKRVAIVEGSCFNIKITTPEDLVLAEAILKVTSDK